MDEDVAFALRRLNTAVHNMQLAIAQVPGFVADAHFSDLQSYRALGLLTEEQTLFIDKNFRKHLEDRLNQLKIAKQGTKS